MMDNVAVLYPHRKKMDGSSDALCLNCLATIAMEPEGADTAADVSHHVCSPWLLGGGDKAGRGRAA
jgi:hypothetical protein